MTVRLHRGDLPDLSRYTGAVAIDTETMGLSLGRDRLCVVQLSPGDGSADVVQIPAHGADAPNLKRLLDRSAATQDFSLRAFRSRHADKALGVMAEPVYCTKIASRLARTYTDKHGLKDLVKEVLGHDLSKQQQSSDWGAAELSDAQVSYAAADVIYLHALKDRLDAMLARERPRCTGGGLLQISAGPGPARSGRLRRRAIFSRIRKPVGRALVTGRLCPAR